MRTFTLGIAANESTSPAMGWWIHAIDMPIAPIAEPQGVLWKLHAISVLPNRTTVANVEQAARDSTASRSNVRGLILPRSNRPRRRPNSTLPSGRIASSRAEGGENSMGSEIARTARNGRPACSATSAIAPLSMSTAQAPVVCANARFAVAEVRTCLLAARVPLTTLIWLGSSVRNRSRQSKSTGNRRSAWIYSGRIRLPGRRVESSAPASPKLISALAPAACNPSAALAAACPPMPQSQIKAPSPSLTGSLKGNLRGVMQRASTRIAATMPMLFTQDSLRRRHEILPKPTMENSWYTRDTSDRKHGENPEH